jgi:hypothetical protein
MSDFQSLYGFSSPRLWRYDENGVKRYLSSFVRPILLGEPRLLSMINICKFVSAFYDHSEDRSIEGCIASHAASRFSKACLGCSLLLSAGFNAFVVSGDHEVYGVFVVSDAKFLYLNFENISVSETSPTFEDKVDLVWNDRFIWINIFPERRGIEFLDPKQYHQVDPIARVAWQSSCLLPTRPQFFFGRHMDDIVLSSSRSDSSYVSYVKGRLDGLKHVDLSHGFEASFYPTRSDQISFLVFRGARLKVNFWFRPDGVKTVIFILDRENKILKTRIYFEGRIYKCTLKDSVVKVKLKSDSISGLQTEILRQDHSLLTSDEYDAIRGFEKDAASLLADSQFLMDECRKSYSQRYDSNSLIDHAVADSLSKLSKTVNERSTLKDVVIAEPATTHFVLKKAKSDFKLQMMNRAAVLERRLHELQSEIQKSSHDSTILHRVQLLQETLAKHELDAMRRYNEFERHCPIVYLFSLDVLHL